MGTMVVALAANQRDTTLVFVALFGALLVGIFMAYRVVRDLKSESDEERAEPEDVVGALTEAFERGQMSEEEYLKARDAAVRAGFGDSLPVLPKHLREKAKLAPDEAFAKEGKAPDDEPAEAGDKTDLLAEGRD